MSENQRSPVLRWLESASRRQVVALCVVSIVLTGCADHLSGADIAFTAIYLLPISLAAWRLSHVSMVLVTFACAVTWLGIDVLDHELPRHPMVEVVNLGLELGIFLLFGLSLSALRRSLDTARAQARTDALTGLANRRAFRSAAEAELERCRRFAQPFSLAYVDVDGFKGVNDRYGHQVGDELLQAIAVALQNGVRRIDVVARLGGDEFALLLPGTGEAGARVVLEKLHRHLADGLAASVRVTCSVGCLTVLDAPASVDELVARADAVMYGAKASHAGEIRHEVLPASREPRPEAVRPRMGDAG